MITVGNNRLRPYVSLTNTSTIALTRIRQILNAIGITCSISEIKMTSASRKQSYILQIGPHGHIHTLLNLLLPYFVVKKQEAEIMIKFCERRIGRYGKYDEEDLKSCAMLKLLKGWRPEKEKEIVEGN